MIEPPTAAAEDRLANRRRAEKYATRTPLLSVRSDAPTANEE